MTLETIFSWSGLLVAPFWILMALFPGSKLTRRVTSGVPGVLLPAALYVVLVAPHLAEVLPVVTRPALGSVAALLATPAGATIAWVHFLAFDLFVGQWVYRDGREHGIHPLAMAPLLLLTLLVGPVGFLSYVTVREAVALVRREGPVRTLVLRLWGTSRPLTLTAAVHLVLLGVFLFGIAADHRRLLGEPVWVKPAKFAASIALYTSTLAWMLSYVRGRRRAVQAVGQITSAAMFIEIAIIGLQAGRGVRSHFNISTPFDATLFTIMGMSIAVATLAGVVALVLLFRQPFEDRGLGWAIRLGLLISILGASLGGSMTGPNAEQRARLQAGLPADAGAHSVGVSDGGPGLPGVGWSTRGGDLRVPHFVGLHAMQALPLFALWVAAFSARRRLALRQRLGLVAAASLAYAGSFGILTWQALRGEPLVHPGALTLWAFGVLAVAVVLLGAGALWRGGDEGLAVPSRAG
ncbi:MAG: DUF4281 domain-containing protein [Myxococcaceae bacterium]|nr:DUF4281 domain-containing protein [Myxococcaceae bacterium]